MHRYASLFIFIIALGCSSTKDKTEYSSNKTPDLPVTEASSKYMRMVGDSEFDPEKDDPNFKLCFSENQVRQYFNFGRGLQYEGEKKALVEHFFKQYKPVDTDQSGLIRVRFIVNCKGETGRFRLIEADENYQKTKFDERITQQLLTLTKSLKGWKPQADEYAERDFYQYLVFKIKNGDLIEMMP